MTHPAPHTAIERTVPTVAGVDLVTSGGVQLVVTCPNCGAQHRHLGLGMRRSACGIWYVVDRRELPPVPAIRAA